MTTCMSSAQQPCVASFQASPFFTPVSRCSRRAVTSISNFGRALPADGNKLAALDGFVPAVLNCVGLIAIVQWDNEKREMARRRRLAHVTTSWPTFKVFSLVPNSSVQWRTDR